MKAVILNSGIGSRMGEFTKEKHKSMIEIFDGTPLIIHQIETLIECGVNEFVITTGYKSDMLKDCINNKFYGCNVQFIYNDKYQTTNYIYSLYLAKEFINDDILLMHGDLYFSKEMVLAMLNQNNSCVVVDKIACLPEKDFKALIQNGDVKEISTHIFGKECFSCQPFYYLCKKDVLSWMKKIEEFCIDGNNNVYAENALNEILEDISLSYYDINGYICMEVDTIEDLHILRKKILQ